MARQELSNVFQDGLMMDLNPINTPKSVLTDCLNGTYITYNGNEFVLQNDMGNYKLKNCKLPTNFIPVGVKGYGDILYIVSYNPITNETEIGSYPAPQSIFTTGDSEAKIANTDDLAPFTWGEDGNLAVEYPTIIKDNKKPIFIFTDSNEETYKLNPGDEFKFSGELTPLAFIYQHLNFYIIDEDNKLYDIDDTQIYNENGSLVSSDTMRKVFWETPGWLAAQYDLYVPDKFNLNLRSLNVPEFLTAQSSNGASSQEENIPLDELEPDEGYFKVSMDLSSQTIITDKLFRTELDKKFGNTKDNLNTNMYWEKNPANVYDHLYIRYLIKRNKKTPDVGEDDYGTFKGIVVSIDDTHTQDYINGVITKEEDYIYYDIPVWKHNYQDDIITAYNNIRPIWFCKNPDEKEDGSKDLDMANYHGVVELTAYPIIKYNGLTLKYTQFSTTQRFPLNTLKNSNNITIADSIYKWSVDNDSCTISFNINGPFVNASDITGRYEIYRINLFENPSNTWKPDTATSSLNDPQSYSKWTGFSKTINAGIEGVWEKPEGQDKEQFVERIIGAGINSGDTNDFINKKEVLMCNGTLSNLVLYGQNTINIDWSSSNEYRLTGYQNWYTNPDHTEEDGNDNWFLEDTSYVGYENQTKTINFSKEGGIYIFRVILEQNESKLAETQQILIPSEVFNEWFGSIDNYNNIYENQWVNQILTLYNINSISINNITPSFNSEDNKYIYKTENGTETPFTESWFTDKNVEEMFLPLFHKYETFYDNKNYYKDTLTIDFKNIIKYSIEDIVVEKNINGNLWNIISNKNAILKNNTETVGTWNIDTDTIELSNLKSEYDINYIGTSKSIYTTTATGYPFKGIISSDSYALIFKTFLKGCYGNDRNRSIAQWRYSGSGWNISTHDGFSDAWYTGSSSMFSAWKNCIPNYNFFVPSMDSLGSCETEVFARLFEGAVSGGVNTKAVLYDGRNEPQNFRDILRNQYTMVVCANKDSTDINDGLTYIKVGNQKNAETFRRMLLSTKITEKSNSPISRFIFTISNTLDFLDKYQATISKLDVKVFIKALRIDDSILTWNTTIYPIDISKNLLNISNNVISNSKTIYNFSIDPITINIDLTKLSIYNKFYENFNDNINKYNSESNLKLIELEDSQPKVEIDKDKYNNPGLPTDLSIETYKQLDSDLIKRFCAKIIGKNGAKLTISNAAWDNRVYNAYVVANQRKDGSLKGFRWVLGYFEEFQM